LILNGFLTFSGLWAFSKKNDMKQGESVKKC
jgi:hypothetical protein